jgi:transposase
MMQVEQWAYIRHLHLAKGLSISAIARKLRLDRKTIRGAVNKADFFEGKKRPQQRSCLVDPFKNLIDELLREYPDLSGTRIFEELKKQGYQGGISILRDYLRTLRPRLQDPHFRLTQPAGTQAQVDWGHCGVITVGRTVRPLYCFVFILSFSRMLHVEFTLSMAMEAFLEAHIKAFRFFQGLTKEILYDNTKTVVLSRMGTSVRFHPRFLDFAGYYGFQPRLCNPRRPREKGRVENAVKYIKANFLAGRSFSDLEDVCRQGLRWRDEIANVRVHSTTRQRPVDLLEEERPSLLDLPDKDYDTALRSTVSCPPDAFVTFQTNLYSVPFSCVGKELTLRITLRHVYIHDGTKLVAEHVRSYDRYQQIEDPSHRRALLAHRKQASFSKAIDELTAFGPECQAYLEGLNRTELRLSHHVQRLQHLARIYGVTELRQAVSRALHFQAFGAEYIENIIVHNRRRRRAKPPSGPVQMPSRPDLIDLSVTPHPMESYDNLQSQEPGKPDGPVNTGVSVDE